jgi:hypothetical protein
MNAAIESMIYSDFVKPATALFRGAFDTGLVFKLDNEDKNIPKEDIEKLTSLVVQLCAELIQQYIDAGSEREVTYEDEMLYNAVKQAFERWSEDD